MSDRPPGRSTRVLVVDDDPVFRGLCVEGLGRRRGLSSVSSSTPREALAVLEERTIDVVVSDVDLPGAADGDGADLYRAVRDRWPALPFVFFTGTPPGRLATEVDLRADPAAGYVRRGCLPGRFDALAGRIERTTGAPPAELGEASTLLAIDRFCR